MNPSKANPGESRLNARRHGADIQVKDHDLLTGRDAKALIRMEVARAFVEYDAELTRRKLAAELLFDKLPWWQRAMRYFTFKFSAMTVAATVKTFDSAAALGQKEVRVEG